MRPARPIVAARPSRFCFAVALAGIASRQPALVAPRLGTVVELVRRPVDAVVLADRSIVAAMAGEPERLAVEPASSVAVAELASSTVVAVVEQASRLAGIVAAALASSRPALELVRMAATRL